LKLAEGIPPPSPLGNPNSDLEAGEQIREFLREGRLNQVRVMSLERLSDRLEGLRVGRYDVGRWSARRISLVRAGHIHSKSQ
jgi:hypothetical protein